MENTLVLPEYVYLSVRSGKIYPQSTESPEPLPDLSEPINVSLLSYDLECSNRFF